MRSAEGAVQDGGVVKLYIAIARTKGGPPCFRSCQFGTGRAVAIFRTVLFYMSGPHTLKTRCVLSEPSFAENAASVTYVQGSIEMALLTAACRVGNSSLADSASCRLCCR